MKRLEKGLKTSWAGKRLFYEKEMDSTNTYLKKIGKEGADHGTVVLCDKQRHVKGRKGRIWISEEGKGIWMSLLIRPKKEYYIADLTYITSLAVAKALEEFSKKPVFIKWPNDIILQKRKIAGILLEGEFIGNQLDFMVIGIGINYKKNAYPQSLSKQAISLEEENIVLPRREEIIQNILLYYEEYMKTLQTAGFGYLKEEYYQKSCTIGRKVAIIKEEEEVFTGKAVGMNHQGELVVEDANGETHTFSSTDISVRGVMGYAY
ncbi:MAG: biotin--[acetyl-CoA-carboxylase] ligase [Clostridiales bacterium]|nr:biotin--[acetyl-CoA-carboxylase] ligase [Clostridiales bacterium]